MRNIILSLIASLFFITPSAFALSPSQVNLSKYDYVDPDKVVPTVALKKALIYYDVYYNQIRNKNYITVVDMTKHSATKRMFVVDMKTGKVSRYLASHGKGSDANHTGYATKFSNTSGSNMTFYGMYVTGEEYQGKYGRSMRMDGLEASNSNARARAIVMHSAWYVDPKYSPIGRSQGCPAVEAKYINTLVTQLKGGSVYYIYAGQK